VPYLPTLFSQPEKPCGDTQGMMMNGEQRLIFSPALLLAILLLLAQCFFLYGDTGRDDAFFTYWPAQTLAEHGKILNYNGELVEQSSTLLHTALLAATHKITPFMAIPTLSWMLSLAAGIITLIVTAMILRQRGISLYGTLILATAPSLVFWSSSGMETLSSTALFTIILLLFLQERLTHQQHLWLAFATSLAVINRPETFLVLGSFCLVAWPLKCILQWFSGIKTYGNSSWLTLLLTTLLAAGLVSIWRQYYFDAWFPQPVTAKSSHDYIANILRGISYIVQAGESVTTQCITAAGLFCWFAALLYWKHPQRLPVIITGSLALAQLAFIIATGGDWMDATRFLLPVLPALLLCLLFFLAPWKKTSAVICLCLLSVGLYDSWTFARTKSTGLTTFEKTAAIERHLPDSRQTGHYSTAELHTKDALRDIPQLEHLNELVSRFTAYPEKLNIASIQMGFIPYHLSRNFPGRLHFLDLRALSTRGFSDCALLNTFPRTENGIKISYDEFFSLLPMLHRQCGIAKPDILYDLGYGMRENALKENGYIITYREKRHVAGDFSTRSIGSELFVAVRRELAAQYQLKDIDGNIPAIAEAPTTPPPNIVLLIADDISYDHFGFMGNPAAHTPTLDQLAQQGTVFTTAYVPTAFCRPSLASLLTGSWPHQNRIYANNGVIALPGGYNTIATMLQKQGYATFAGGKFWEDEPELRGFDNYDVRKESFARDNQDALWRFIEQHSGKQPLFIWWAPMLPHTPHNPPQTFLDAIDEQAIHIPSSIPENRQQEYRSKTRNLLAMNLWMDDEIRKLKNHMDEKNLTSNTLFIFLADNGFSHQAVSKSAPYELGIRTPVLFSWPENIRPRIIDTPTNSINIYNTVLDYAGVTQLPLDRPQPGHSLRAVLEGRETVIPEKLFGADYQAVTTKTEQAPRPEHDIFSLHVRDGDWKYIFYLRDLHEEENDDLTIKSGMSAFPTRQAGDEELYFLPADSFEENNLASHAEQQERIENYRRDVLQWWYSTGGKTFDASRHCPAQPVALCQKLATVKTD
jgi:arylsulfatase A-like enzyme